ncbi:MAG TPA: ATP-dependent sacrificial sulfur transferase LarE [Anaerolineae bacterium]|nr:ATP-dependent sacrificial sulfur transferase LarE [Anaerolineae bacterium]
MTTITLIETRPISSDTATSLDAKLARLRAILRDMGRVIIALSGGVDSAFLWLVAHQELGENALAVTAVSPSLASWEREDIARLVAEIGGRHRFVETHEVDDPNYAANPINRCYFCKDTLWETLDAVAAAEGVPYLLDGYNLDDMGDFRPGQQAGQEHRVRSPLKEAGFTKADIREAARRLGLSVWNKPAAACLASRFAYGVRIDAERLSRVDRAERWLRERGFSQLRVRVQDEKLVRIEVPVEQIPAIVALRRELVAYFKSLGFVYITVDLEGFRSGSMNEVLDA